MTDEIDSDANNTHELTAEVARALIARGWRLTTAESCTGGIWRQRSVPRADTAAFYDTGVVTFSDEAKRNVLQVRAETLAVHSAVSEACVQEMSSGILALAGADIAIAVSGYAGPEGGEDGTPPARYGLHWNFRGQTETKRMCFAGDCETVVAKAVRYATGGAERKACPLAVTMPGARPYRSIAWRATGQQISPMPLRQGRERESPETGVCPPTAASTTPPGFRHLQPPP